MGREITEGDHGEAIIATVTLGLVVVEMKEQVVQTSMLHQKCVCDGHHRGVMEVQKKSPLIQSQCSMD